MKTLSKLTLSILLLFTLTAHAFYVPDLFGAYEQGASRARYENQQDTYYYEEIRRQQLERQRLEQQYGQRLERYEQIAEPRLYVQVINQNTGKAKDYMNLSLKKNELLCWTVYPISNGQTYHTTETFTMPVHATFTGNAGQEANNKLISSVQTGSNTAKFERQIYATNNQINSCWQFPANTPKGIYHIRVGVGRAEFGTQSFKVVD